MNSAHDVLDFLEVRPSSPARQGARNIRGSPLRQCILFPRARIVDVFIGGNDIEVARQNDRVATFP